MESTLGEPLRRPRRQHEELRQLDAPRDLSRVDAAFFTANGFVSVTLCLCGIAQVLARGTP
jgi:hypothetical protein